MALPQQISPTFLMQNAPAAKPWHSSSFTQTVVQPVISDVAQITAPSVKR
jgi:hypothetical protein